MNKIIHVGMLMLSFSHVMQAGEHKHYCIKKLAEQIRYIIDKLDSGFEKILYYGNPEGYELIEEASLVVDAVEHEPHIQIEQLVSFLNTQMELIVKFIKERPTSKDKVIGYMMQFKNKIDLINLITACIGYLNTMYQDLLNAGHKKDAVSVRKLIIYATEVRSKWVNRSSSDSMKMLENLRNSLK
ncbi:hypothetical protein EKK58_01545 [Candidatus Dependentiae bacterium]|nr:MAG: hypothetical protein EKK58_01545 [Candidatus Dependentiae bacterium]